MRLFGISIDEDIRWATALAEQEGRGRRLVENTFSHGELIKTADLKSRQNIDLQHLLRRALEKLKTERSEIFHDIDAIGISSIGVIDPDLREFVSIARKRWSRIQGRGKNEGTKKIVIDFDELCEGLFSYTNRALRLSSPIIVHNDATAKALAEYHQFWSNDRDILYLMFDEGVNGGMIYNSGGLPTNLHPEMGHILPALHPLDHDFISKTKLHGGCPSHVACYESVASLYRIRKSWGPLNVSSDFTMKNVEEDEHWNIIAYYVAQLCMTGTLILSPQRIILGGRVISDDLIPLIHKHFEFLNNEYLFYPEMADASAFIQISEMQWQEAGPMGALFLAHSRCLQARKGDNGVYQVAR